jgi:HSP20 family protein
LQDFSAHPNTELNMAYRGTGLVPFFGSSFPMSSLRREIDRIFDDAGAPSGGRWMPAADVREDDDAIHIDIELAGIDPKDIDINVENGMLTIAGEKHTERKEGKEGQYHSVERRYGSFARSFQLPQGVDESKIGASFDNGLLTVDIPRSAMPQPRRIQIGGERGQEVQAKTGREQITPSRTSGGKASGDKMAASGTEGTPAATEGRRGTR